MVRNPNRVCYGCSERLTQASNALRRHASLMALAVEQFLSREPTEEELRDYTERVTASFNETGLLGMPTENTSKSTGLLPQ
jgi:hypothetical protein